MFYVRKEKEYGGLKFYLTTAGSNSWWVSHDYRDSKKMIERFDTYGEAIKFYNAIEKNYEVVNV